MDDVLRARAQWCAEIDDWEGTIATHLEALRQHEIEGNAELEARAWLCLGIAKYQQKKFHEALENFEQARSKFKGQKLVADVARCDRWLADSYSEVGEGERAYEHARKSMDIASLTQDRQPLMFSEFVLGKSLRVLGKLDDAERHLDTCHGWAVLNGSSDVDWKFVVEVQSERVKVLRLQERQNEADEVEQQIQTVQEVIQ